jgi:hypothetical protein
MPMVSQKEGSLAAPQGAFLKSGGSIVRRRSDDLANAHDVALDGTDTFASLEIAGVLQSRVLGLGEMENNAARSH